VITTFFSCAMEAVTRAKLLCLVLRGFGGVECLGLKC
jgi:hypothetical protein